LASTWKANLEKLEDMDSEFPQESKTQTQDSAAVAMCELDEHIIHDPGQVYSISNSDLAKMKSQTETEHNAGYITTCTSCLQNAVLSESPSSNLKRASSLMNIALSSLLDYKRANGHIVNGSNQLWNVSTPPSDRKELISSSVNEEVVNDLKNIASNAYSLLGEILSLL